MDLLELHKIAYYSRDKIETCKISTDNYISTDNMKPNKQGIERAVKLPPSKTVNKFIPGDILISNIRPYFKKIWFADKEGGASSDILVIRCKDLKIIDSKYLYYVLSRNDFFEYVMLSAKGSKMPRGDKDSIMKYRIHIPSLEEQKKIVKILSTIDTKIEVNAKLNKDLDALAQSLFEKWFVKFDLCDEVDTMTKQTDIIMEDSELGLIPKGWSIKSLGKLGEVIGGATPSTKISEYYGGDISWITPKDLSGYNRKFINKGERNITELGYKSCSTRILPRGTVLFSSRAPIGYVVVANQEVCTNQGFKSIICDENLVNTNYIYYFLKLNTERIANNGSGSTFKEISANQMREIKVILPTKDIMSRYGDITTSIDNLIIENYEEIDKLTELRESLIPQLISGKIAIE
ncbi:hypothetical protein B2H97_00780 [Paraclostridium bifermentans]|nr:hypothetical protein B2H97_00780 [Paraclostridium bifermentans]